MKTKLTRYIIFIMLFIMLVTIPTISTGCAEEKIQPSSPLPGIQLSSTLVPNMDLDVYLYFKQENLTTIPQDITGAPVDVFTESLAIWGIPVADDFTFGGGLTLASIADATMIYSLIKSPAETWTKLSDRTIYFVLGSGVAADTLKAAISQRDLKYYDDQTALTEVALLPNGDTTRLAAVGIAKPSKPLVNLITKNLDSEASGTINTLLTWAKLQVITIGLYAPQQIEVSKIAKEIGLNSIWQSDLGILASAKSGLPGFVVSPIVKKFLVNNGYTEIITGELTLFKGSWDIGNGKTIPVFVRVEGNRMFAALSGEESYAETLITSVNR